MLHAKSVTKRFGGLVAVNKADLVIPKGSIVSLIGPNGAGKTTFFNIVAGILDPTSGVDRVQRPTDDRSTGAHLAGAVRVAGARGRLPSSSALLAVGARGSRATSRSGCSR